MNGEEFKKVTGPRDVRELWAKYLNRPLTGREAAALDHYGETLSEMVGDILNELQEGGGFPAKEEPLWYHGVNPDCLGHSEN